MDWVPHGVCLLWQKWLILIYAVDNLLIFVAYLAISLILSLALRRIAAQTVITPEQALPPKVIFIGRLFSAFILSCGIGHLLDMINLWYPLYGVDAVVKTVTAIVSVTTAAYFPATIDSSIDIVFSAENVKLELIRVSQKVQLFLENGPFCAYIKNEKSQMTWYNEEICRRFGVKKDTWLGQNDAEFLEDKVEAQRIVENDLLVLEGGVSQAFVETTINPQGRCHWVSSKFAFHDPITREKLLGGISLDITQSLASQRLLGEATTQLEETEAQLKRRKNDILTISDLATTLLTCDDYREAQEVVGVCAKKLFREMSGSIFIIAGSRDMATEVFTWGDSHTTQRSFGIKDCWAVKRNVMNEIASGEGYLCRHITKPEGSHLCIPLLGYGADDPRIGLFYLQTPDTISAGEKDIAEIVARLLAISINNMQLKLRLREESIKDPLTGVYNRRYMEETLTREFAKAEREAANVVLIMLDLDNFGAWNKRYGVQVGDLVLREVGLILMNSVRRGDIACRYGGEELITILLGASLEQGTRRAEELRRQIEAIVINHHGKVLGAVTGSFGVACYPSHGTTIEQVVDVADRALRQAKQDGKNQVCTAPVPIYEPALDTSAPGDSEYLERDGD